MVVPTVRSKNIGADFSEKNPYNNSMKITEIHSRMTKIFQKNILCNTTVILLLAYLVYNK